MGEYDSRDARFDHCSPHSIRCFDVNWSKYWMRDFNILKKRSTSTKFHIFSFLQFYQFWTKNSWNTLLQIEQWNLRKTKLKFRTITKYDHKTKAKKWIKYIFVQTTQLQTTIKSTCAMQTFWSDLTTFLYFRQPLRTCFCPWTCLPDAHHVH